jgi:hypothetical protein
MRSGAAEGIAQSRIEVGQGRDAVIEERQAVGDGAIGLTIRRTTDDTDQRGGDDEKGSEDGRTGTPRCSFWPVIGHATIQPGVALSARMWFSISGRYVPACTIEGACGC